MMGKILRLYLRKVRILRAGRLPNQFIEYCMTWAFMDIDHHDVHVSNRSNSYYSVTL